MAKSSPPFDALSPELDKTLMKCFELIEKTFARTNLSRWFSLASDLNWFNLGGGDLT